MQTSFTAELSRVLWLYFLSRRNECLSIRFLLAAFALYLPLFSPQVLSVHILASMFLSLDWSWARHLVVVWWWWWWCGGLGLALCCSTGPFFHSCLSALVPQHSELFWGSDLMWESITFNKLEFPAPRAENWLLVFGECLLCSNPLLPNLEISSGLAVWRVL